jgi:superfamily II DNA/RNA helicase
VLKARYKVELSHKVNLLLQIVQNSRAVKDRLLVFSHRIPTINFVGQVLEQAGVKFARLDGKTAMKNRQDMTKDFNTGNGCDVFLISTRAGGVGFNLHGANRVVLFDFSFNPTWEEQAIGRAYRLGQSKPVFVYRFISAGTFEETLFNQTVYKLQLAYQVVEKKNTKAKAHKMRSFIKPPTESKISAEDLTKVSGKDHVLDAIIADMLGGEELIHSVAMAETLKDPDEDQLDEQDRAEMQQLIREGKLRNTDPEAFRLAQAARYAISSATGRLDPVNSILKEPAPISSVAAPVAPMYVHGLKLPPARTMPFSINPPPQATFRIPSVSTDEPHGLTLSSEPLSPQFNLSGFNDFSPPQVGSNTSSPNGSPSSSHGRGQHNGI